MLNIPAIISSSPNRHLRSRKDTKPFQSEYVADNGSNHSEYERRKVHQQRWRTAARHARENDLAATATGHKGSPVLIYRQRNRHPTRQIPSHLVFDSVPPHAPRSRKLLQRTPSAPRQQQRGQSGGAAIALLTRASELYLSPLRAAKSDLGLRSWKKT